MAGNAAPAIAPPATAASASGTAGFTTEATIVSAIFKRFGRSRPGFLDGKEFGDFLTSVGFKGDTNSIVVWADRDGGQGISKEEFLEWLGFDLRAQNIVAAFESGEPLFDAYEALHSGEAQKSKEKSKMKTSEAILNIFKEFDQNGDGIISKDELKKVMKAVGFDGDIAAMLRVADVDRDGMVSYREFVKWLDFDDEDEKGLSRKVDNMIKQRLLKIFEAYDRNGDGVLSKPEIVTVMGALGFRGNLNKWIEQVDLDHDKVLSRYEFIQALFSQQGLNVAGVSAEIEAHEEEVLGLKNEVAKIYEEIADLDGELSRAIKNNATKKYKLEIKEKIRKKKQLLDKHEAVIFFGDQIPDTTYNPSETMGYKERILKLFEEHDQSGDGTISKQEFERVMRAIGFQDDINALFTDIDLDGSGGIDYEEFIEWMDFDNQAMKIARAVSNSSVKSGAERLRGA